VRGLVAKISNPHLSLEVGNFDLIDEAQGCLTPIILILYAFHPDKMYTWGIDTQQKETTSAFIQVSR